MNCMKKMIIFGAGATGAEKYKKYKDYCNIIGFSDNDENKWGSTFMGLPVCCPNNLQNMYYDYILIASVQGRETIPVQLQELGINHSKIRDDGGNGYNRERILEQYKKSLQCVSGACAELGVFRGDTAAIINKVFSDRKLYLFDTFEGFDKNDIKLEQDNKYSNSVAKQFGNTIHQRT